MTTHLYENQKDEIVRLYETQSNALYNFIYKMTGDRSISEDIFQETFLCAFQKIETFRGNSTLSTWIFSIAKNYCLQHLRKSKITQFQQMKELIEIASSDNDNSLYSDMEKKIFILQVKEGCLLGLLRCLPLNQRLAFILHVLYDLSVEDTSKIIEKSANATRILVHRSRTKIKGFLCKNCSLYKTGNDCRCENLISFSLKKGWIRKENSEIDISGIESELHDFRNEILLYKSLYENKINEPLSEQILSYIKNSDAKIFSKKVK